MLRIGNIIMQGDQTLFAATMDGLQMEKLSEGINHLAGIEIILITILKNGLITVPNMKI